MAMPGLEISKFPCELMQTTGLVVAEKARGRSRAAGYFRAHQKLSNAWAPKQVLVRSAETCEASTLS